MRVLLACVLVVGCLDAPPPQPQPAQPAPRLTKAPLPSLEVEPPPAPREFDWKFTEELEVRDPARDGRLSLIPILSREPGVLDDTYETLAEGMRLGSVVVNDTGDMFKVVISNRSTKPLVVLGGELIVGGQQDRLVVRTSVIPAKRTHTVATVCAEPGRMNGPIRFTRAGGIAEPTLRKLARADAQVEVWDRIRALGATGSYRQLFGSSYYQGTNGARREHLLKQLDAIDNREEGYRTVGFAVAIDDRIVAIEQFATARLYKDLRHMLIASYIPSSNGPQRKSERELGAADVRKFSKAMGGGERVLLGSQPVVATTVLHAPH